MTLSLASRFVMPLAMILGAIGCGASDIGESFSVQTQGMKVLITCKEPVTLLSATVNRKDDEEYVPTSVWGMPLLQRKDLATKEAAKDKDVTLKASHECGVGDQVTLLNTNLKIIEVKIKAQQGEAQFNLEE